MWRRIRSLLWIAAAALAMRACVMEPVQLTDDSMRPGLNDGDVAFVSKLFYGLRVPGSGSTLIDWASPKKDELVVLTGVGDPPATLLRRVTGVPGDSFQDETGKSQVLKPGEYYLLADKAEGTLDSRKLGPVMRRSIVGKVTYVWHPSKTSSPAAGSRVDSPESKRRSP